MSRTRWGGGGGGCLGNSQVRVFENKKFKEPLRSTSFIVQNCLGLRTNKERL